MPKATPVNSDAELARALKVDRALVCRLKRRGMPTDTVEAAEAWRAANVRARIGGRRSTTAPDSGQESYIDFRARRERAEADRAEILAMRARQMVLLRAPAEKAIFEGFRGLRDAAFQAMRDVAPIVRDLDDVRLIQLALEEALRASLERFMAGMQLRLDGLAKDAT